MILNEQETLESFCLFGMERLFLPLQARSSWTSYALYCFLNNSYKGRMTSNRKIINDYCYNYKNRLGDGVSSEVYGGYNLKTNEPVAIKVIPKVEHCVQENLKMAETELKILQELSGKPNIVMLYFTTQTRNNIYIVIQLGQKGSLSEIIKQQGKLPEDQALKYLKQLINGYRIMAEHKYIHRDIKPSNLLITAEDELLLGDFGLCIQSGCQDVASSLRVGSPLYMAPELIDENVFQPSHYTCKSDIWAIGVTFLQMLLGRTVWRPQNEKQLVKDVLNFQLDLTLPPGISKKSELFLKRALCKDPLKRLTVEQMLVFFDRFDHNLEKLQIKKETQSDQQDHQSSVDSPIKKKQIFLFDQIQKNRSPISPTRIKRQIAKKELQKQVTENNQNEGLTGRRERKMSFQGQSLGSHQQQKRRERKQSEHLSAHQQIPGNKRFTSAKEGETLNVRTIQELIDEDPEEMKRQKQTMKSNELEAKKSILKQLQGHINYFRFVFKVLKKMKQVLRIKDKGIDAFKSCLLHLFMSALNESRELSHIKDIDSSQLSSFRSSGHYANLVFLLNSYQRRYEKQQEKENITSECKGDSSFLALADYVMKVLYQNILSFEKNLEMLNRKKMLVFILEDLMVLVKGFMMSKRYNWRQINQKVGLSQWLEGRSEGEIDEKYWREVKDRFQTLAGK